VSLSSRASACQRGPGAPVGPRWDVAAGFAHAQGETVVTIDGDLQDDPAEIPRLLAKLDEGFDLVSGWKTRRRDPWRRRLLSRIFNAVTGRMSGLRLHDMNCGLKAYDRRVVKGIEVYGEMHRYIPVIAKWNGFRRIGEKVVQHQERKYGTTKFGLERFVYGFLDLDPDLFGAPRSVPGPEAD